MKTTIALIFALCISVSAENTNYIWKTNFLSSYTNIYIANSNCVFNVTNRPSPARYEWNYAEDAVTNIVVSETYAGTIEFNGHIYNPKELYRMEIEATAFQMFCPEWNSDSLSETNLIVRDGYTGTIQVGTNFYHLQTVTNFYTTKELTK